MYLLGSETLIFTSTALELFLVGEDIETEPNGCCDAIMAGAYYLAAVLEIVALAPALVIIMLGALGF